MLDDHFGFNYGDLDVLLNGHEFSVFMIMYDPSEFLG